MERTHCSTVYCPYGCVPVLQSLGCGRLQASVVPRFIPTCSQELLDGLGSLAQAEGLVVHSHISESR